MNWLDMLSMYMTFPFVQNALIVGVLIALCSALLGTTLVLRRYSFVGDSLSHVAFLAIVIAGVLRVAVKMELVLPITVIATVLVMRSGSKSKMSGDAALAMISVGSLSLGYLLMNLFPTKSNLAGDVCTILFGSTTILNVSERDTVLCIVLSVVIVALFILFYHKIFAITFDDAFAAATGTTVWIYQTLIAVLIAVVIVLAMNLVGSLLITALIIFPTLTAMRVFRSFLSVTICAAVCSVVSTALGIVVSVLASTPVGSTIVAADMVVFVIFALIGLVTRSRAAR